jgi:hypothetical protein
VKLKFVLFTVISDDHGQTTICRAGEVHEVKDNMAKQLIANGVAVSADDKN